MSCIHVLVLQVPTTVFTPLEFAAVGLSEERACQVYGSDCVEVFILHVFEWLT